MSHVGCRYGVIVISLVYKVDHGIISLQLDIDPVTAKTPFFAPENATKWAVSEQWHTYWMERRQEQRHTLSLSSAVTLPNHVANR
jgi:hypothetical protein